jgi:hypothetical protein
MTITSDLPLRPHTHMRTHTRGPAAEGHLYLGALDTDAVTYFRDCYEAAIDMLNTHSKAHARTRGADAGVGLGVGAGSARIRTGSSTSSARSRASPLSNLARSPSSRLVRDGVGEPEPPRPLRSP